MQCFIIMPISDPTGYETGHFSRVYKSLIIPACRKADFDPIRADDINQTDYIAIDILKRIADAEMAICDISARNPNVMYELGLRHALDMPVTIIKDSETQNIFDIQGIRQVEYDISLRIDTATQSIDDIAENIKNTYKLRTESPNSANSLMHFLNHDSPERVVGSAIENANADVDDRNYTFNGYVSMWSADHQRGKITMDNEELFVNKYCLVHQDPVKLDQKVYFVPQAPYAEGKNRRAVCAIGMGHTVEAVIRYANLDKYFCFAEVADSYGNRQRVFVEIPRDDADHYREGTKILFEAGENIKGVIGLNAISISD